MICPGAHRPAHECEGIQFWPELCTVLLMGLMSGCRQALGDLPGACKRE